MARITLNKNLSLDAVVIGAGVAGCAAALELFSSGRRVAVLHREDETPGHESLSPEAARRLDTLSVSGGSPFSEVIAWWGSDAPSRMSCQGARIIQRASMAREFRLKLIGEGISLLECGSPVVFKRQRGSWEINYEAKSGEGCIMRSRCLVDATGRACAVGRSLGAYRESADKLCCLVVPIPTTGPSGTWTEATVDG